MPFSIVVRALLPLLFLGISAGCEGAGETIPRTPAPGDEGAGTAAALEPPRAPEGSSPGAVEDRAPPEAESDVLAGERGRPLVVVMGTSLTQGEGLSDPDRESWPARLAERAREAGLDLEFRNAGLSGETSAGARRRVGWILDRPPDLFLLETGANDGLRALDPSALEENLDAIFSEVRETAPGAKLVLAGMEAPPNLGADYVEAFRSVYPRVAERWDATLVPFLLEGVAGVPGLNLADGVHPNPEGHRRIGDHVWSEIRSRLEALSTP